MPGWDQALGPPLGPVLGHQTRRSTVLATCLQQGAGVGLSEVCCKVGLLGFEGAGEVASSSLRRASRQAQKLEAVLFSFLAILPRQWLSPQQQ